MDKCRIGIRHVGCRNGTNPDFRQLSFTYFSVKYYSSKIKIFNVIALNKSNILHVKSITYCLYFGRYGLSFICNFEGYF
jgi:hypothetical protein